MNDFDYTQLKEYQIIVEIYSKQTELMRALYKSTNLCNDDYYHYLLEDGYLLIRCHESSCAKLEATLNRRKKEFTKYESWDETNGEVVRKHLQFFGAYLHICSEFVMQTQYFGWEEDQDILERVYHCFYDILPCGITRYEYSLLNQLALTKCYNAGYWRGKKKAKSDETI